MHKRITQSFFCLIYLVGGFLVSIFLPAWAVYLFGFFCAVFGQWAWRILITDVRALHRRGAGDDYPVIDEEQPRKEARHG